MTKLPKKFIDSISHIVSADSTIYDDDALEKYGCDETPELFALPDAVIIPENSAQVEKIVRLCYKYNISITPRGAGTGVAGGAVPVAGGIVLSLERLNQIIDIDRKNLIAVVQPGVITGNIQRAVAAENLYYPPDPASVDSCSIGGNVATCAGGMRAFKYGVTKKFVQGLEVIMPPGEKVKLGGKMIKDVSGYDLIGILTGSEGTLGIFTEIMLRLVPLPKYSVDLLAGFESVADCAKAALSIVSETGIQPAAMEFIEDEIVEIEEIFLERKMPLSGAKAQLIVSVDGFDEQTVENEYMRVGEHLFAKKATDVLVANNRFNSELLWEARRSIRDALRHRSPDIAAEDLAVPPTNTPDLLAGVKRIGERYNAKIVGFGHIGDGNLHIDLLRDDMSDEQWRLTKEKIVPELLKLAVKLDGTITGEHGIGYIKRKYLHLGRNNFIIDRMQAIKSSIDPMNLMNPQKIFP